MASVSALRSGHSAGASHAMEGASAARALFARWHAAIAATTASPRARALRDIQLPSLVEVHGDRRRGDRIRSMPLPGAFVGDAKRRHGSRAARASSLVTYRSIAAALGAGLLAVSFGCGGRIGGEAGEIGVFEADAAQGSAVGPLAVLVAPGSATLCPGQCAMLSAQPGGGHAPYSVQWDHGLASKGAAVRVCPTATTTYGVVVTDSSGHSSGELQTPSATASGAVTVTVTPNCQGAAADDAGLDDAALESSEPLHADYTLEGDGGPCVNAGPAPWSGCETISFGSDDAGHGAWIDWCTTQSPNSAQSTYGLCLPKPLLTGQSYSIRVTYDVQGVTGPANQNALYGSTQLCAESQELTPLQTWPDSLLVPYTGSFTQSACATANANYPVLLMEEFMYASIPTETITIQVCTGCPGNP